VACGLSFVWCVTFVVYRCRFMLWREMSVLVVGRPSAPGAAGDERRHDNRANGQMMESEGMTLVVWLRTVASFLVDSCMVVHHPRPACVATARRTSSGTHSAGAEGGSSSASVYGMTA
jgi:hypothetical protein